MEHIPCLTETKRLPQDFLLVNVYREMTGHILYRPVKFRRGLQVWQIGKHYFLQHPVGLCLTVEASWHSTQSHSHSQFCKACTWRRMDSEPRLHGDDGSHWDFQRDFWLKAFRESLERSEMLPQQGPPSFQTRQTNVRLQEINLRGNKHQDRQYKYL